MSILTEKALDAIETSVQTNESFIIYTNCIISIFHEIIVLADEYDYVTLGEEMDIWGKYEGSQFMVLLRNNG